MAQTATTARHPGEHYDEEVAALLRGHLASKRIKKRDLAQRLGRTDFWVGRRLNGQTPISVGDLAAIAEVLDEPLTRFLPGPSSLSVSHYGSEGWGFESLRARPDHSPLSPAYSPRRRRSDRRRQRSVVPLYLVSDTPPGDAALTA